MVSVRYGNNNKRSRVWERMKQFAILIASIFITGYYPKYTNLLSMNNKKLLIVSAAFLVHALGKQVEIKSVSVHT